MLTEKFDASERRACKVIDFHRATKRYKPKEDSLNRVVTPKVIEFASKHGRYGYKRVTALIKSEGFVFSISFFAMGMLGTSLGLWANILS